MIHYHNGRFWAVVFQVSGSVIPAALLVALPASILVCLAHVAIRQLTDIFGDWTYSAASIQIWNGFNLILGFLIVFRSQQAYSRWWEGGTILKQMRGDWFNAYSSLLAFTNPAPEKQEVVSIFNHQIVRLFSLLHASALEYVTETQHLPLDTVELSGFDTDKLMALKSAHNKVEVILQWIQKLIVQSDSNDIIRIAPPILSRVFNDLGNGIVQCNNAKKITEFPFPFPMAQLMAVMLGCHLFFTIYVCVIYVPGPINAFCTSFAAVFAFWSINLVSIEIEMPFGDDCNDLPLFSMQLDFNLSLSTLLEDHFITPPQYSPAPDHQDLFVRSETLDNHLSFLSSGNDRPKHEIMVQNERNMSLRSRVSCDKQQVRDMPVLVKHVESGETFAEQACGYHTPIPTGHSISREAPCVSNPEATNRLADSEMLQDVRDRKIPIELSHSLSNVHKQQQIGRLATS